MELKASPDLRLMPIYRPSHPNRTMVFLLSSSLTVAGPSGIFTPFRFFKIHCYNVRMGKELGQVKVE
jgi:hypothetical protein